MLPSNAEPGDAPLSLRARWVFPVWGPPLENGTVEITDGLISAVHDRPGPCSCDLGNVAIIPGLVNAHTHLELSDVAAPVHPASPFTSWLRSVVDHRRSRAEPSADSHSAAASRDLAATRQGLAESLRWGTTTIGDILGPGGNPENLAPLRAVGFLELLGLAPERAAGQIERARAHLAGGNPHVVRGLSPHAPYSVHPDLFRALVGLAVEKRAPLAMHLAETRAELELLDRGAGEFLPFLEELGVWRPDAIPHGTRPLDYLREMARLETGLVIHGNYLSDEELAFLAAHPNLSVVYCPRTHAFFDHEPHPWQMLLARGVNVALGTDSRASNPDLGLWNELVFLRSRFAGVDPARLLKLGTWNGAFALGMETKTGSLALGKSADLAFVELPAGESADPYAVLFHPAARIMRGMLAGQWIDD